MTRPLESDYNSQVAYTRALEAYCDSLAQPEQEPVAWQWLGSAHFRKKLPKNADITAWNPLYTTPPKQEPRNFCPRCGKRTADLTVIHTCTPPRELEMT